MGYWDSTTWINDQGIPDPTVSPYAPGGPLAPGGAYVSPDPLHPGDYYRDDPSQVGGIVRLDSQGNVVGSYQNTAPLSQGGSSFNPYQLDPATGGPALINYPTEQGGFLGLGDVGGSLAAVAMLAALAGSAGTLAAPAAASTTGLIGAGATTGGAGLTVASQAAQNADLAKAGMALSLAGGATGAAGNLASGSGTLGDALSTTRTGLTIAGTATDNPALRQASQAAGYANTASGVANNFTGGSGSDTVQGNPSGDTLQGSGTMGSYNPYSLDLSQTFGDGYTPLVAAQGLPGSGGGGGSTPQTGQDTSDPSWLSKAGDWLKAQGSSLTVADALKLGIPLTALGLGMGGVGNTNATPTISGTAQALPNQEALFKQLRDLGLSTTPENRALMGEAAIRQTQQANASPMALLEQLRPSIQQIREKLQGAFQRISGQMGPSGGGQLERGEQSALGQAGNLVQTLFAAQPAAGLQGLNKNLTSFKPAMFADLKEPITTTKQIPNSFGDISGGVQGLGNISKLLDKEFGSGSDHTTPSDLRSMPDWSTLTSGQEANLATSGALDATTPNMLYSLYGP